MRIGIIFSSTLVLLFLTWSLVIVFLFISNSKEDDAMYRIESGNQKVYYANTFRMIGKGIMFDDVHGKKIILTGDIDIEYIKNQD